MKLCMSSPLGHENVLGYIRVETGSLYLKKSINSLYLVYTAKGIDLNSKRPDWIELPDFGKPTSGTLFWHLRKMWLHTASNTATSKWLFSFYAWSIEGAFDVNNVGVWDMETYKEANFKWKNCVGNDTEVKTCTLHGSKGS